MEDKSIKIRVADAHDYSACLPLLLSLYHGDVGRDFKQTFEEFVEHENGTVLLAENNDVVGILIGSYHLDIDWEGKTGKIDALIVGKAFRRMGIGRRLLRYFIVMARKADCKAIKSRVNRKNEAAQNFHKSLGFWKADTYEYVLDFQIQRKQ